MGDTSLGQDPVVRKNFESVLRAAFGPQPGEPERPRPEAVANLLRDGELQRERTRYQLLGEIARGGMGVILRGRDPELGRDVAVKVLRDDLPGRPAAAQRFLAEARIVGRLQHPGIVPIYEYGRMADQRPYFAMKLVEGRTLAAQLAARTALAQDRHRFLTVFELVCQTMAFAHSRGVIHRDLKPANIMVGPFGEVQILDWGLAKVLAERADVPPECAEPSTAAGESGADAAAAHSLAGAVMGTPAYMPPEQARGEVERVDRRSDVFSLGGILCEILTGEPPYAGESSDVRASAVQGATGAARARLQAIADDPELSALCARCLAAERDERPRDASEVARAIATYRASIEERASAARVAAAEARVKLEHERKARLLTVGLAASVVLILLVGGGGWLWAEKQLELRRSQTAEQVNGALDRAALLYGEASSSASLAPWLEAQAQVERARALLEAGEPSEAPAARVEELGDRVFRGLEGAQDRARLAESNARLLARLQDLRAPNADGYDAIDWTTLDAEYAAAFAESGLGLDAGEPEATASEILGRGLDAVGIAAFLDDWAAVRRRASRSDGADRLAQVAESVDPDPLRSRLRAVLARNDPQELARFANDAALDELPVATLDLLGGTLVVAGEAGAAMDVLQGAQRKRPDDYVSNVYLARLFRERDYHEAARHYAAALAVRPDDPLVVREYGYLLDHYLLEHTRAIALYRSALVERPEDASLHLYLGHALRGLRDYAAAIAAYDETLRIEPGRWAAHLGLLRCYRAVGKRDVLIAKCREHIREVSNPPPEVHLFLGEECFRQGDLLGAIDEFRRAVSADPAACQSHEGLRLALEAVGDHEGSRAAGSEVLRLGPDFLLAYFDLGLRLAEYVDVDREILRFRDAVRLDPASPTLHAMLGALLREQGHYSESLFQLRSAHELGADLARWTSPRENISGQAWRLLRDERRSEVWVSRACELERIEQRLEPVLLGADPPRDAAERLEIALLALRRGRALAAARLYAESRAEGAGIDAGDSNLHRLDAVAAAAQVGCGRSSDAAGLSTAERAEWRARAAEWMRADLESLATQAASAALDERMRAATGLGHWFRDPRLACVRDAEALAALSPDEQGTWRALWARVGALGEVLREAAERNPGR